MERFEEKYIPEPNSGCWLWLAAAFNTGYGAFKYGGNAALAHRVSWTHARGPIPVDLEIDHKCRNRLCVNPDHLHLVTKAENARLALPYSIPASIKQKLSLTHCKRGHPFAGDNLAYDARGARRCRTCAKLKQRKRRAEARMEV